MEGLRRLAACMHWKLEPCTKSQVVHYRRPCYTQMPQSRAKNSTLARTFCEVFRTINNLTLYHDIVREFE
jgi:hypothetical protein